MQSELRSKVLDVIAERDRGIKFWFGTINEEGVIKLATASAVCFRELYFEHVNPVLVFAQYRHAPIVRGITEAYLSWLMDDSVSPWRTLQRECIDDCFIIPADQPGNLILNFLIASRLPVDLQSPLKTEVWYNLYLQGINPTLAHLLLVMTAHSEDGTWGFKTATHQHDPIDGNYVTEAAAKLYLSGQPCNPSVLYSTNPRKMTPCNVLWYPTPFAADGQFQTPKRYYTFLCETYLAGRGQKPSGVFSGLTPDRRYDANDFIEVARQEQRRLF